MASNIFKGKEYLFSDDLIIKFDNFDNSIWIGTVDDGNVTSSINVDFETSKAMVWAMLKATALDKPGKVGHWLRYNDGNYEALLLDNEMLSRPDLLPIGKWILIEGG